MPLFKPIWMNVAPDDFSSKKYNRAKEAILYYGNEDTMKAALECTNKYLCEAAVNTLQSSRMLINIAENARFAEIRYIAAQKSNDQETIARCFENEKDISYKLKYARLLTVKYLPLLENYMQSNREDIPSSDYRVFDAIVKELTDRKNADDRRELINNLDKTDDLNVLEKQLFAEDYPEKEKDKIYAAVAERIAEIDESKLRDYMLKMKMSPDVEKAVLSSMNNPDYLQEIKNSCEDMSSQRYKDIDLRYKWARSEQLCPNRQHDFECLDIQSDTYNDEIRIQTYISKCRRCGIMFCEEKWGSGKHNTDYYWKD